MARRTFRHCQVPCVDIYWMEIETKPTTMDLDGLLQLLVEGNIEQLLDWLLDDFPCNVIELLFNL